MTLSPVATGTAVFAPHSRNKNTYSSLTSSGNWNIWIFGYSNIMTIRDIATVHRALGDETRLRLMNLLFHFGELCVCDLEGALEITQSKTSRHLRILRDAQLVFDRRDGAWVYYRIDASLAKTDRNILDAVISSLRDCATGKQDILRAQQMQQQCSERTLP